MKETFVFSRLSMIQPHQFTDKDFPVGELNWRLLSLKYSWTDKESFSSETNMFHDV